MSDGITDCRREEEKQAAGMVEKCCENCRHSPISPCEDCNDYSSFDARKYLIAAKVEELREQMASKRDSASKVEASGEKGGGESKKSIWRDPKKEPVEKGIHFLLTTFMGGFDWTDQADSCEFSILGADGYMYFSDLCKVLKVYPKLESERAEMIECLKSLTEWNDSMACEPFKRHEFKKLCEQAKSILKKAEGR